MVTCRSRGFRGKTNPLTLVFFFFFFTLSSSPSENATAPEMSSGGAVDGQASSTVGRYSGDQAEGSRNETLQPTNSNSTDPAAGELQQQMQTNSRQQQRQSLRTHAEMPNFQQLVREVYASDVVAVEDLSTFDAGRLRVRQSGQPQAGRTEEPSEMKATEGTHGDANTLEAEQTEERPADKQGEEEAEEDEDEEGEEGEEEDEEKEEGGVENYRGERKEEEEDEEESSVEYYLQQLYMGIAYDLPVQLRPREGGSDPGYLQLMLDERMFNDLMNSRHRELADEEEEDEEEEEEEEKKPQANGVFLVCYVKRKEELDYKFDRAMELGEGVYVPLQKMTDFARHKDFTLGNPGIQSVQLSAEHFKANATDWSKAYFAKVRELKEKTNLKVGGMWYGPPDYEKIDKLMRKYPGVFDGIYFNWEDGKGSCMNNLSRPPRTTAEGTPTYWADKSDFFFRYFMGGQDGDVCKVADGRSYVRDVPVNVGRELNLPDGISPVFPCFGGSEGLCYKAFSKYIEAACDGTLQRFSFAIYDRYSDRMRLMLEEGCKNLGVPVPPMDFVGAL